MKQKRSFRIRLALLLSGLAGLGMMVAVVCVLALAVRLPWPLFDSPLLLFAYVPAELLVLVMFLGFGLTWGCQLLVRHWLGIVSMRETLIGDRPEVRKVRD
jgi:hypothetical protein